MSAALVTKKAQRAEICVGVRIRVTPSRGWKWVRKELVAPERGKTRELCERLYPDLLAA